MLRAGRAGFVLKGVPTEDVQRAVRAVGRRQRLARPGGHRPGAGQLPFGTAAARLGVGPEICLPAGNARC